MAQLETQYQRLESSSTESPPGGGDLLVHVPDGAKCEPGGMGAPGGIGGNGGERKKGAGVGPEGTGVGGWGYGEHGWEAVGSRGLQWEAGGLLGEQG